MSKPPKDEADGDVESDADSPEGEGINDPLTRTDVEAPRVPFGADPPSED